MTFLHSKKIKLISFSFILPLLVLVGFSGMGAITIYSMTVDTRYDIKRMETAFQEATVHNAELKDEVYSLLDRNNVVTYANTAGFVLDRNPEYLEINTPDSISIAQKL